MSTKFFADGRIVVGPDGAQIAADEEFRKELARSTGAAPRQEAVRQDGDKKADHVRAAGHANVMTAHACEMNTKKAHEAAAEAHEDMAARHRRIAESARQRK